MPPSSFHSIHKTLLQANSTERQSILQSLQSQTSLLQLYPEYIYHEVFQSHDLEAEFGGSETKGFQSHIFEA